MESSCSFPTQNENIATILKSYLVGAQIVNFSSRFILYYFNRYGLAQGW